MKVLIAAASFASSISGVQRHALNVARCLLLLPEISEVHLVVAPWQSDLTQRAGLPSDLRLKTHVAGLNHTALSRNMWYWHRLPEFAVQLNADLVHLSYPMPLNRRAFPCPTVITLHDLYPYEIPMNFGFPKFIFNRIVLQQCLRASDAIACVSSATRMRLTQYAPAAVCERATTIYNCIDEGPLAANESPIPGWNNEPFLLCVAQHRRNKNIPTLIRAFDLLIGFGGIAANAKLVVVGTQGPETQRLHRLSNSKQLKGRVHFLEGLSEPQLQWCYRHCEALVAPSLTEGFDLPVAEGLLAGCRIVCSDIAAHREVAGDRCRFVALRENAAQDLAAAIVDTLKCSKPQPIALPLFSAPVVSHQYLALYCGLIESSSPKLARKAVGGCLGASAESVAVTVPEDNSALACRGR